MSDAAITAEENKQTPPASSNAAATAGTGDIVTLKKEEYDKFVKAQQDLETARALQAQADKRAAKLEKLVGRRKAGVFNSEATPPVAPTPEELDAKGVEEDRKAERGLIAIAVDPKYRDILDTDPTLRNLLTSNPLGVLPIIAPQALDAEDAIDLVKEHLDTKLLNFKKPTPPTAPADKKETTPPTPPVGGVNVPVVNDEAYEKAKKISNTENAIAGMIKVKLGMGKK